MERYMQHETIPTNPNNNDNRSEVARRAGAVLTALAFMASGLFGAHELKKNAAERERNRPTIENTLLDTSRRLVMLSRSLPNLLRPLMLSSSFLMRLAR
jgi:hypothetical protein